MRAWQVLQGVRRRSVRLYSTELATQARTAAPHNAPKDKKMAQAIIKDHLSYIKCPIVQIEKYSHHNGQIILPIGVKAQIDTNQGYLFLDKIKNFI